MRKLILFIVFIILGFGSLSAQFIPDDKARAVAERFFKSTFSVNGKPQPITNRELVATALPATITRLKTGRSETLPPFYIFQDTTTPGYVIVSSDRRVKCILAYSLTSSFPRDIPPALTWLLNEYARATAFTIDHNIMNQDAGPGWSNMLKSGPAATVTTTVIEDFVSHWEQEGDPFNTLTPNNNPAGCDAIAIGQIMFYHKYPSVGSGSHSYIPWTHLGYGRQSADFGNTHYRWEEMLPGGSSYSNPAMSEFIRHLGVSINMDYDPDGSSSNFNKVQNGLSRYFGYNITFLDYSSGFTLQAWTTRLKQEIDAKPPRPIDYRGYDPANWFKTDIEGGHAFVLIGYDEQDRFLINWGWNDENDGYYSLELLNPLVYNERLDAEIAADFKWYHEALVDIKPKPVELNPTVTFAQFQASYSGLVGLKCSIGGPDQILPVFPNELFPLELQYSTDRFNWLNGIVCNWNLEKREFQWNSGTIAYAPAVYVRIRLRNQFGAWSDWTVPGSPIAVNNSVPELYDGTVTPKSGTTFDSYKFSVTYKDLSGQSPPMIRAMIGSTPYVLAIDSGAVSTGATYAATRTFTQGTYDYYFEAQSGAGKDLRFPGSGTMDCTVSPYAQGHDIAALYPVYSSLNKPGGLINATIQTENHGIFTETNFPVEFKLYKPNGTLSDSEVQTVSSISPNGLQVLEADLATSSTEGFYLVTIEAKNTLDQLRSNNWQEARIYVGNDVDSDEYESVQASLYPNVSKTVYGQQLIMVSANANETYIKVNGVQKKFNKGQITGVISDTYALMYYLNNSSYITIYFGPASDKISVSPNPVVTLPGEEHGFVVTAPPDNTLYTDHTSTTGEGFTDGATINTWITGTSYISTNSKEFLLEIPKPSTPGLYEGWIQFDVLASGTSKYYFKVIRVKIENPARDLSVTIDQPISGSAFFSGDSIPVTGTIKNQSIQIENVDYSWNLIDSGSNPVSSIPGTGNVPANSSLISIESFKTAGLAAGSYTLSLELKNVTDDNPGNNKNQVAITLNSKPLLIADFAANITGGKCPLKVKFTDLSSAVHTTVTGWAWDFSHDGTTESIEQNPSFTFSAIGNYSVGLVVSDAMNSSSEIKPDFITVYDVPMVSTGAASNIAGISATIGGTVIAERNSGVTERGICLSKTGPPAISDSRYPAGAGPGDYSIDITGLEPNTVYYCRAYAINGAGAGYGDTLTLTTAGGNNCPTWTVDPEDFSFAGEITAEVFIDQVAVTGGAGILGAFVGSECRGVVTQGTTGPSGRFVFTLSCYSNQPSGETMSFRYYNPENDTFPRIRNTLVFSSGMVVGDEIEPFPLNAFNIIRLTIHLAAGWTWFSLNLENTDMSVGKVFGGLINDPGDYIKNQTSSVTYYGEFGWFGELGAIDPRSSYKIKRSREGELIFEGYPVDPSAKPIEVYQGWNWIGYTLQKPETPSYGLQGIHPVGDDYIKSQTVSSTFYEGYGWFGDLNQMNPAEGYMLKTSHPGILIYPAESPNSITDSRDGQEYKWVKIGNQIWMAENLAYLPEVSPSNTGSGSQKLYYVYDYEGTSVNTAKATPNYAAYGAMYNWPAAYDACPNGWHLPADEEWKTLEKFLGMSQSDADGSNFRYSGSVGEKLKTAAGWSDGGNGSNSNGFAALPGGDRYDDRGFNSRGYLTRFWASEDDAAYAWGRLLSYYYDGISRYMAGKSAGYSVRCIKDSSPAPVKENPGRH